MLRSDANGNLVSRGADSFGYDQANRLKTASVGGTSSGFVYDGDGKRASKTVGGNTTSYLYDVNASLPVLLEDGERKYVWGLGLAYAVDSSGGTIVYHSDGLGSVRALSDGAGLVVQAYRYDEYGMTMVSEGSIEQPFRYTGEQTDETGLVYLRARYYDAQTGRFLGRDPIVPSYRDPRSINRYAYARNSPASLVDPSGHVVWLPIAVGAVIGGTIGGIQAAQATNDPMKIAAGVGIGAAAGGASGIALGGTLVTAGMGLLAGGASNVATQAIVQGRGLSQVDVGSAVISGLAGGLGAGGAIWAGRWIGTGGSSLASWICNNSVSWDDEAIEAGLSGAIAAAVDFPLQTAWAQTPWAVRSDLSAPHGSATLGLRPVHQPSK